MKIILEKDDGSKTEFEVSKVTKLQGGRVVSEVASPTPTCQRFEVKQLCHGRWFDLWSDDGKLWSFDSQSEAHAALSDLLNELGDFPENYKIVEVQS